MTSERLKALKGDKNLQIANNKNFIYLLKTLGIVFLLLTYDTLLLSTQKAGVVNIIAYLITGFLLLGNLQKILILFKQDLYLLSLIIMVFASTLWSTDPLQTLDVFKSLALTNILGLYLSEFYSIKEQINIISIQSILAIILSLYCVVYLPHVGINPEGLWNGIYGHKQNLGRVMAFGAGTFFCIFVQQKNRRTLAIIGYLSCIILLLLSQSKTALLIVLSYPLLLILYKILRKYYKIQIALLMLFVLFCFAFLLLFSINSDYVLVDLLGKDSELNGRTPLWEMAIQKGLERPWLGYGYAGFWTSSEAYNILDNVWPGVKLSTLGIVFHAHSGFIDLFLQLGAIGLIAFIGHFAILFTRVISLAQITKNIDYFWIFLFLIITVINNSNNFITFLAARDYFWSLYVSFSILTIQDLARIKNRELSEDSSQKYSQLRSNQSAEI